MNGVRGFVVLVLLISTCLTSDKLNGYQVLRLDVNTSQQKAVVRSLQDDVELDIWSDGHQSMDVMVPPSKLQEVELQLQEAVISYTTIVSDVQQLIDAVVLERGPREVYNYSDFNTYEDTMAELQVLAADCADHPTFNDLSCVVDTLSPQTIYNRTLQVLRVIRPGADRKIVYLDSLIHAREWLSGTTLMNIANDIVHGLTKDGRDYLERYDFYFNPVVNPDGYYNTWNGERNWRKNLNPNSGSACVGVDLNRNYDNDWGIGPGSSNISCGSQYRGASPASEAETQAIQADIQTHADRILTYVTIHTYSQYWLTAYATQPEPDQCKLPPEYDDCQSTAATFAAMVTGQTFGTTWVGGDFCTVLYPASGTTPDYATGQAGVTFALLPELRGNTTDGSFYGFFAPASEIIYAYQETWNGILGIIVNIQNLMASGTCQI